MPRSKFSVRSKSAYLNGTTTDYSKTLPICPGHTSSFDKFKVTSLTEHAPRSCAPSDTLYTLSRWVEGAHFTRENPGFDFIGYHRMYHLPWYLQVQMTRICHETPVIRAGRRDGILCTAGFPLLITRLYVSANDRNATLKDDVLKERFVVAGSHLCCYHYTHILVPSIIWNM